MNLDIILIGIIVGIANLLSRFIPIWLLHNKQQKQRTKRSHAWINIALASIGTSAICAMLVVATLPPLLEQPNKLLAAICGFIVLGLVYFNSKKIVLSTLLAALSYGLIFTYVKL